MFITELMCPRKNKDYFIELTTKIFNFSVCTPSKAGKQYVFAKDHHVITLDLSVYQVTVVSNCTKDNNEQHLLLVSDLIKTGRLKKPEAGYHWNNALEPMETSITIEVPRKKS